LIDVVTSCHDKQKQKAEQLIHPSQLVTASCICNHLHAAYSTLCMILVLCRHILPHSIIVKSNFRRYRTTRCHGKNICSLHLTYKQT